MRLERTISAQLLTLLRDGGPYTRSQLAELLEVSRTTVTTEVAALARDRLVAAGPTAPSSGGRRSSTVQLGPAVRVAAVSAGETRVRATVVDGAFTVSRPVTRELPPDATPDAVADAVGDALREALADGADGEGADGAAGRPDRPGERSHVLCAGLAVAPDATAATDELLARRVAETAGAPVTLVAAGGAAARGERYSGASAGLDHVVVVRLGATVSAATVLDGRPVRGSAGLAGAIGHVRVDEFGPACTCGGSGCLDSFVSMSALLAQAEEAARTGRSPVLEAAWEARSRGVGGDGGGGGARAADAGALRWADLVRAVDDGDPVAVQLVRDAGRRVGEAVAALVAFANPTRVLLAGPGAALGPHLLNELRAAVYRRAPARVVGDLTVELGAPGDRAALLGAALEAFDAMTGA
jgi:predicted NBD/HSP70 family sugar kinase